MKKKKNGNGEKFMWKNVKWLRFIQENGIMMYRESLDAAAPFKIMTLGQRAQARNLFNSIVFRTISCFLQLE